MATRFSMRQRQARGGLGPRDSKLLVISDRISKSGSTVVTRSRAVRRGLRGFRPRCPRWSATGRPRPGDQPRAPRTWRGLRPCGRSGTGRGRTRSQKAGPRSGIPGSSRPGTGSPRRRPRLFLRAWSMAISVKSVPMAENPCRASQMVLSPVPQPAPRATPGGTRCPVTTSIRLKSGLPTSQGRVTGFVTVTVVLFVGYGWLQGKEGEYGRKRGVVTGDYTRVWCSG